MLPLRNFTSSSGTRTSGRDDGINEGPKAGLMAQQVSRISGTRVMEGKNSCDVSHTYSQTGMRYNFFFNRRGLERWLGN